MGQGLTSFFQLLEDGLNPVIEGMFFHHTRPCLEGHFLGSVGIIHERAKYQGCLIPITINGELLIGIKEQFQIGNPLGQYQVLTGSHFEDPEIGSMHGLRFLG